METDKPATEQSPEIVDPHNVPVIFVDWIVSVGVFENVVSLTLGSIDPSMKKSDSDLARVTVAARLRCSTEFIHRLAANLSARLPAPAPNTETSPPKNQLN